MSIPVTKASELWQVKKMFNCLTFTPTPTPTPTLTLTLTPGFEDFLKGKMNSHEWYAVKIIRPTFRGRQDALHRQLYRYFISDDIEGIRLTPTNVRGDVNPYHWRKGNPPKGIDTTPGAIDNEVLELVEELKRRRETNYPDIWEGVEEVFTPLEIAQARELLKR